jgi:aminopeptidase N
MKYILLLLMLSVQVCFGQEKDDIESIARMEMQAHQNRINGFAKESFASENIDVKYYRCEWEVEPAVRYIKGKVTVYFKPTEAISSLALDLADGLIVEEVRRNNIIQSFTRPTNSLSITLNTTLNAGILDSISILYKGIPANTGFGSFILNSHAGIPVMWTLSEPYGSRDWWPCKNGLTDKADSIDIFITHPSYITTGTNDTVCRAASNGMLQSETLLPGGKTVTHWKHRYPIASYLVCMAVTNYAMFNNTVQLGITTLPMQTHCYPENKALWQTNTPLVLEAMQYFHNNFGPYPFIKEKYGHVQFGWGGGMEHQTSSFIVNTGEYLMAHELGHQWFGDKITCTSWEDIWLNEGFATYLGYSHLETKYPANLLTYRRNLINSITSQPGGMVKVQDTTNLNQIFSGRLSYNKGSYLLFMLRYIVGDEVFLSALRRYQQDPAVAYGTATTADFKRNIEAESGKNLTYFFNQWYTGEGFPSYQVKWNVLDTTCVNIKLSQTTSMPSSTPFFKLPVTLKFKNDTQEKTIVLDNNANGETFIRTLGFKADTVLVDPGLWLVTKNNTTEKTADINDSSCTPPPPPPPTNSGEGIVDIWPNPVTNPFVISLHDFNDDNALVTIYNKLGQRIYNQSIPLLFGIAQVKVPMNNWVRGVYIVKVVSGGKTVTKQFVR